MRVSNGERVCREKGQGKKKLEHFHFEASAGKNTEKAIIRGTADTEAAVEMEKFGAKSAQKLGLNFKSVRSTGKSMVSMHGISQEKWDRIFKKKRKGNK